MSLDEMTIEETKDCILKVDKSEDINSFKDRVLDSIIFYIESIVGDDCNVSKKHNTISVKGLTIEMRVFQNSIRIEGFKDGYRSKNVLCEVLIVESNHVKIEETEKVLTNRFLDEIGDLMVKHIREMKTLRKSK